MTYAALKYDSSAPDSPLPAAAVRRWLHGRWALLFSHPDDFASYGFESDRWLVHVQEAFTANDIRPLAIAGRHEAGWITEVGGRTTTLAFDEIQRDARFVLTLDASVRLRRTFVYTRHDKLPSPIDLAQLSRTVRRDTPAIPFRR
jgi:hypothetical protein